MREKGAATMREIFLRTTEPTTDSLVAIPRIGPTTADHHLCWRFRDAAADRAPLHTEPVWIDDLGEAGYRILQPIPVKICRVGIGDCEASFHEANIAMSGSDSNDAFQALVAEILDTFDALPKEQNLGPDAAEQLRFLRA